MEQGWVVVGDGNMRVGGRHRWSVTQWRRGLVMKEFVHGIQGIDDEDDVKWRETLGMGVAGGVLGGAAGGCGQRRVGRWPLGGDVPMSSSSSVMNSDQQQVVIAFSVAGDDANRGGQWGS
ncbi:hypothetical protein Dimus_027271 [Dionaea muscipula]